MPSAHVHSAENAPSVHGNQSESAQCGAVINWFFPAEKRRAASWATDQADALGIVRMMETDRENFGQDAVSQPLVATDIVLVPTAILIS